MIPEDRKQAQARARVNQRTGGTMEQVVVLLMGTVALLGFLLV